MESKRDISIDIIRGIAIFVMLGANVVGYVTSCKFHPVWFDVMSSLAAPLFILISGYMVASNSTTKHRSVGYYLKRAGLLIITAALIDTLIWQILPFGTFDVLYVIGLGMLVAFVMERTPVWARLCYVAVVLAIAVVLQCVWEYREMPLEVEYLSPQADYSVYSLVNVAKAFFHDGWFPVFPWIAFPVLGSLVAHFRTKSNNNFANVKVIALGSMLAIVGSIWLYFGYTAEQTFDELVKREPYGELFYPATLPFVIGAFGICLLVFSWVDSTKKTVLWKPLIVFGQTSLFNYILHSAIIAYLVYPYFEENLQPLHVGWIVYALLALVCLTLSYGVVVVKRRLKIKNFFFNFYFGG